MSLPSWAVPVGLELARLGIEAAQGKAPSATSVARSIVGLGLQLVPREELIAFLSEDGIARGELAVDIAEAAKFDGASGVHRSLERDDINSPDLDDDDEDGP